MGRRLTSEQESVAENWLLENYPEYLPGVLAFKIKDREYRRPVFYCKMVENNESESRERF